MIYIYLSTCKWSLASSLIRYGTRCKYSHAGFYDTETKTYLSAQLNGGVQIRTTDGKGIHKEKFTRISFFTAPGIEKAYAYAKTLVGSKYDWKAILGIATDQNWHVRDNYFCSEDVAYSFEQTGNPIINSSANMWVVTPRDIPLSLLVTEVKAI